MAKKNSVSMSLSKLCTPAMVYFVISMIAVLLMLLQNMNGSGSYTFGNYSRPVGNVAIVFLGKVIYILFWTFILNFLCKKGFTPVSWFLVLLPFLLFFVIIGMFLIGSVEKAMY